MPPCLGAADSGLKPARINFSVLRCWHLYCILVMRKQLTHFPFELCPWATGHVPFVGLPLIVKNNAKCAKLDLFWNDLEQFIWQTSWQNWHWNYLKDIPSTAWEPPGRLLGWDNILLPSSIQIGSDSMGPSYLHLEKVQAQCSLNSHCATFIWSLYCSQRYPDLENTSTWNEWLKGDRYSLPSYFIWDRIFSPKFNF